MTALMINDSVKTLEEKELENISIFQKNKDVMKKVEKNTKLYSLGFFILTTSQAFLFQNDHSLMVSFLLAAIILTFSAHAALNGICEFLFEKPHHITTGSANTEEYNKTLLILFSFSVTSYLFCVGSLSYFIYSGYAEYGIL